jgi:hypothetical protein
MRAGEGPARGDAVALGDLLVHREAQVREQLAVERHGLTRAVETAVLHGVHVVDELLVVDVGDVRDLPS